MKLRVRFRLFASLRDAVSNDHLEVEIPAGIFLEDAINLLLAEHTELQNWRGRIAFAWQDRLLNGTFVIDQPMQIDLLPPVSGG